MRRVVVFALLLGCSNDPPPQAWPAGEYCVLRDGPSCPRATNGTFEKGSIVIDTDNGVVFNRLHGASSELRDREDGLLSLEVCCGNFADTGASFPNEPFAVLAGGDASAAVSCPAGFTAGSVFIDAEDSEVLGDSADSYIMGNVGASTILMNNNVDIIVCESGPDLEGPEMPRASYCVFAGSGGCPSDFSSGTITTYDEASGNTDAINGTVGAIRREAASTIFPVCCY